MKTPLKVGETRPSMDEVIWKTRYERLKQFMEDAEFDIRHEGFERSTARAWDAPPQVYVSFAFDVCDSREKALKTFGDGKFDRYSLLEAGPDAYDDPEKRKWNAGDLLRWAKAQIENMECRADEDCDHCVGLSIITDVEVLE